MISRWINSIPKRTVPRWVILIIDAFICAFSFVTAFILRLNFQIDKSDFEKIIIALPIVLAYRLIAFYWTQTYRGVIRHTGTQDAIRIFIALASSTSAIALTNFAWIVFDGHALIPTSITIMDFIFSLALMTASRIGYKLFYGQVAGNQLPKRKVIIFGAGQLGVMTKKTLEQDISTGYRIVAFLDDDHHKHRQIIDGVDVFPTENLPQLAEDYKVDDLVIAVQQISKARKTQIIEEGLSLNLNVKNIPAIETWINGELNTRQIKNVRIEDLLDRDEIKLDRSKMSEMLQGKVVLVTGAAGSIGSEIVRQIIPFSPARLILFDNAETPMHNLQLEIEKKYAGKEVLKAITFVIGDIRNRWKVEWLLSVEKPDLIYHAAAYKHVPLMEINPVSAINTNIIGTRYLADAAVKHGVKKFVMVSTDKAVNPTNVMGATKRAAEIFVQSLNFAEHNKNTRFITTRFGNVLGSNGSVIPHFRQQIENGGPVTVTHPDITRYFMTIPEACQLVLEAGNMGNGGEIYLFDMGQSVKIVDLARKMIKLSGFTPDKDIKIEFTGLRPGEKLREELLNDAENTLPTHHHKILIGKIIPASFEVISESIYQLEPLMKSGDRFSAVAALKAIVPEFISNNSEYCVLDKAEASA